MHISFTILAALGLAASAHSTTNKRQPSKYEACTNPGFEWCDQGEMVACKKGYVAGLQKRCATKRQAEINDTCFNYGTQWCDDDGECLTCKKVANVEQGRVIRINKRRGVKKRGIGSWCDNIGATWCQDYKMLTCTDHHITRTGSGCDSGPHHGPDHDHEHRPEYNPEHSGPENNSTTTTPANPNDHGPEDDPNHKHHDGKHDRPGWNHNGTEHHGPSGPPGRPGDGYGNGVPTPNKGHGPYTNGTEQHGHHGPPECPEDEHHGPTGLPGYGNEHGGPKPDEGHGHGPYTNGTDQDGHHGYHGPPGPPVPPVPSGPPAHPDKGTEHDGSTPENGEEYMPHGHGPVMNGTEQNEHHGPPDTPVEEHHGDPDNNGYMHILPVPDKNHEPESTETSQDGE